MVVILLICDNQVKGWWLLIWPKPCLFPNLLSWTQSLSHRTHMPPPLRVRKSLHLVHRWIKYPNTSRVFAPEKSCTGGRVSSRYPNSMVCEHINGHTPIWHPSTNWARLYIYVYFYFLVHQTLNYWCESPPVDSTCLTHLGKYRPLQRATSRRPQIFCHFSPRSPEK